MQPIMLYLLFIHLALSEDIWYHPMNTASASWSGSVSYSVLTGNAVCPAGNNYCYHLTDPGYVDYTAPSNNPAFQRIDLTYAMGASGMSSTEGCSLLYSVDNGVVWTTIQQLSSDGEVTNTYSLSNPSADNVAALTIRLEFTGHKNHECYFNEFRLSGTRITTNPTDNPSAQPSNHPTQAPTNDPTSQPSADPTRSPSSAPSSAPSGSPSNAPSSAPSSAPSRAPSASTLSPSNVPTTVNPTAAPSSAPSSAPSESTLSPTNVPTSAPSGSTWSPTSAPSSAPTTPPTKSPTYVPAVMHWPCNGQRARACIYADIAPLVGVNHSRTITIQNRETSMSNTYYEVYVTPTGTHCVDPSITLTYERIDYDGDSERLGVILPSGATIKTCGSSWGCGSFATCVEKQSVGLVRLAANETNLLVKVKVPFHADDVCSHNLVINARLTIFCSAATAPPTLDPTAAPSVSPTVQTLAPTAPPTAAPSVAPTLSPTYPTNAPTFSPTRSPSTAPSAAPTSASVTPTTATPSQPPTNAPSDAPTNPPSHAPTAPTVNPTNAPSAAPTVRTLSPTPNPTAKVSCGSNKDCYSVYVVPIDNRKISTTMAVSDRYPGAFATYYDVSYHIAGSGTFPCMRPSITFTFEPVDNDAPGEYLYVQYLGQTIASCLHRKACNTQKTCLDHKTLGDGSPIATGQTILIRLIRQGQVSGVCDAWGTSINARLTLHCDDSPTAAPTAAPSVAPTGTPTAAPSVAPTQPPSDAPTSVSQPPTSAPSTAPTMQPSGSPTTPTAPPTQPSMNPTKTPTVTQTNSPTAQTINPTKYPTFAPTKITVSPTRQTVFPSAAPSDGPSRAPTTAEPTKFPSAAPTNPPSHAPTAPTVIPTNTPSAAPTAFSRGPTHNPSISPTASISPTQSPTANPVNPTAAPTPQPSSSPIATHDASLLFSMVMTGLYRSDDATLSLILMTKTDDFMDVKVERLLESPLMPLAPRSISELSDYSMCQDEESSDCTKFWRIDYAQSCDNDGNAVLAAGDWKVRFTVGCRGGSHDGTKQCLDATDAFTYASLTTFTPPFADAICGDALYSALFTSQLEEEYKYAYGDVVQMKVIVEDERNEYTVNDVEIRNVFLCALEDTKVEIAQQTNGIFGCLTLENYATVLLEGVGVGNGYNGVVLSDGSFSFTLQDSDDFATKQLLVQIQTVVTVSNIQSEQQSTKMQHFTANIKVQANKKGLSGAGSPGGTAVIVGGVIGSVLFCVFSIYLIGICCKKKGRGDVKYEQEMGVMSDHSDDEKEKEKKDTKEEVIKTQDSLLDGVQVTTNMIVEESDEDK